MPLNVVLGELEDNEIVESALKCLKKALPLTFLVVDLPLLLPRVVGRDLEQALDIPQQGLRTRDRGVLGALRYGDRRRGYLRVIQGLGRTFRARCWQRQVLRHVRQICKQNFHVTSSREILETTKADGEKRLRETLHGDK